tara:strand:- start:861 stop:1208 length:348 start_codon:yes stop_codon:yes gene_type:complete
MTEQVNEVKVSKQEQLKAANAKAKTLAAERKALREEVNAGKEERADARKLQASSRKEARSVKSDLAKLTAKVNDTFKTGDSEAIALLADAITNTSTELSAAVRKFSEATKQLEEL